MNKKFISYIKKNYPTMFYRVVRSEPVVAVISKLDYWRYLSCRLRNQPYFGVYMMAGQTWEERVPHMKRLAETEIANRGNGDFRILEVGSWAGHSALLWAEAIRNGGGKGEIVCIDPWVPYFKDEKNMINVAPRIMERALRDDKIFNLFRHNISAAGFDDMVTPMRGTSDEVLPTLRDGGFDLVFIDGAHYYSNVIRDLKNAEPLLREGGILCGDDLDLQLGEIDREFAEAKKESNMVIDPKTGREFHPGVSLAVAEFFQGRVTAWNGFWAMRRTGDGWRTVNLDG